MKDREIHIVGAGPAGLAAAIYLSRAGFRTVVFEKSSSIGGAYKSSFQFVENWSTEEDICALLRGLGIQFNFLCQPIRGVTVFDSEGRAYPLHSSRPLGYIVTRGGEQYTLDTGLFEQARAVGAEFRFGEKIENATERHVIVATGMCEPDARIEQVSFLTSAPDSSIVLLNDALSKAGHVTLFIRNGRGTLTCSVFGPELARVTLLDRTMEYLQSELGIDIDSPHAVSGSVGFSIASPWQTGGRLLKVGGRAGFNDALTGYGLRHALISGIFAGRSIAMTEDYDQLCSEFVIPSLKVSLANRSIFSQLGNRGYEWGLRSLSGCSVMGVLRRHYQESKTKSLLHEIARLGEHPWSVDQACHKDSCQCLECEHGRSPSM